MGVGALRSVGGLRSVGWQAVCVCMKLSGWVGWGLKGLGGEESQSGADSLRWGGRARRDGQAGLNGGCASTVASEGNLYVCLSAECGGCDAVLWMQAPWSCCAVMLSCGSSCPALPPDPHAWCTPALWGCTRTITGRHTSPPCLRHAPAVCDAVRREVHEALGAGGAALWRAIAAGGAADAAAHAAAGRGQVRRCELMWRKRQRDARQGGFRRCGGSTALH